MYLISYRDNCLSIFLRVEEEKCSNIKDGVDDCSSIQKSISFIIFG
jgi:hypothetical protein